MKLDSRERVTLSILLQKELTETSDYINQKLASLNASKSTSDVRWYSDIIKGCRKKKATIENILNKI
jgi:hypothetical protein